MSVDAIILNKNISDLVCNSKNRNDNNVLRLEKFRRETSQKILSSLKPGLKVPF